MSVLLEVQHLKKSFGGIHAVDDLSFVVQKGEVLGLIGPNGSGKSTCVNLISGTYRPEAGRILFDGKEIPTGASIGARVRLGMGRTFQTPKPFGNMTVWENVLTTALQHMDFKSARLKTQDILEQTELIAYRDLLASKLPIEKRKWLDLARILTNNPKFIMLDEVMAGLNPQEMEESLQLVQKINDHGNGVTFLFIEHVMKAVVQLCSRVVVINQGQFLAEGLPQEVLTRQEVVDAYIGGKKHAESGTFKRRLRRPQGAV